MPVVADAMQHTHRPVGSKRGPTRGHVVEHRTKTKQIGAMIGCLAVCLLGRHVVRRAGDDAGVRETGVIDGSRQTEVGQQNSLDSVFQQDVRRLDVAMDHSLFVSRRES